MNVSGGFNNQVNRLNAQRLNDRWQRQVGQTPTYGLDRTIKSAWFNKLANDGYSNKRGYSIMRNPITGENEMFVAGTRTGKDWMANVNESFRARLPGRWRSTPKYRKDYEDYISKVARDNNVKVMYGHSRGGSLVHDTDFSGRKVGLDAATVMNHTKARMTNYRQGQVFDHGIGFGYRKKDTRVERGTKYLSPVIWDNSQYRIRDRLRVNPKFHYVYRYKNQSNY